MYTLKKHCSNLKDVLAEIDDFQSWLQVYEWLLLAASIESVNVDTIQHQAGFGFCSAADEYSLSYESLANSFVQQITVFTFVWGALEAAIEIIKPPKHPDKSKRGKIRNTCFYLNKKFSSYLDIIEYKNEVSAFKEAALECLDYERVTRRFNESSDLGVVGVGLYVVYELRNSFAHGSIDFPEPDEENEPNSGHSKMVEHATRIVLITLQMLLIVYTNASEELIEYSWDDEFDREGFPLIEVLRGLHVGLNCDQHQLSLL